MEITTKIDGGVVVMEIPLPIFDGNESYDYCVSCDVITSNANEYGDYESCFNLTQSGTITTPHGNVEFVGD